MALQDELEGIHNFMHDEIVKAVSVAEGDLSKLAGAVSTAIKAEIGNSTDMKSLFLSIFACVTDMYFRKASLTSDMATCKNQFSMIINKILEQVAQQYK